MKPLYLEFCGINSFSETAKINFEKLLSGGIFGIFGDTGSGKSTILDAIHFALYGKIERASGVDSINYKSEKATVLFEFELTAEGKRKRYGVTRERRRKNNVVKASFYEYDEENLKRAIAEGAEEVTKKIETVLGLSFDEFKKCIALPQGEFAALVKATNAERVKLVSRIFDLEKYGERLAITVRSRYSEAKNQADTLYARMEENAAGEDGDEQTERALLEDNRAQLKKTEQELEITEKAYLAEEKKLTAKKGYEELCLAYQTHLLKRELFEEKKALLAALPKAKAVILASDEKRKAEKNADEAKLDRERAQTDKEKAELKKERAELLVKESGVTEEIERATVVALKLEEAEADTEACQKAKKKLDECLSRYKSVDRHYEKEEFDLLLEQIEKKKETLGEDVSFTEFLETKFKGVLLAEEYAAFRKDLRELAKKHENVTEDTDRLIKKYTPYAVGSGESFDVAQAKLIFDETAKERKKLVAEAEAVQKRKRLYEDNEAEKELIKKEGKIYREEYERAKEKIAAVEKLGTLKDAKETLERLKKKKEDQERAKQEAEKDLAAVTAALKEKTAFEARCAQELKRAEKAFEDSLKENGFETETQAREQLLLVGEEEKTKRETDEYFSRLGALEMRMRETDEKAFQDANEQLTTELALKKQTLQDEKTELVGAIAVGGRKIEELTLRKAKYEQFEKEYRAKKQESERWEKLRHLIDKNKFMSFIASEYLQEVCINASSLLLSLTGGRYYLRYDEEFKAVDNLNGGVYRAVKTLSGGETFLVSLSLALSLSAAICEKSLRPIEFFFLDEGFGTLDEKLVDTVMDGLDKLKSNHFSIGVISHVEELKHRIENKIVVSGATESRGSTVKEEILV